MVFVRLARFPNGTRDHYEALAAELVEAGVPRARLLFAAGAVPDGWQVIQVWERKSDLDDFNARWFFPALDRVPAELRFPVAPLVTDFHSEDFDLRIG